jgi:hypothetical protein
MSKLLSWTLRSDFKFRFLHLCEWFYDTYCYFIYQLNKKNEIACNERCAYNWLNFINKYCLIIVCIYGFLNILYAHQFFLSSNIKNFLNLTDNILIIIYFLSFEIRVNCDKKTDKKQSDVKLKLRPFNLYDQWCF